MTGATKLDKKYWDTIATLGCIACLIEGNYSPVVSIHHVDGRTKTGCQHKVLPLCAGHHQNGTGNDKTMIAVHPFKSRFQARYGHQDELIRLVKALISVSSFDHERILQDYKDSYSV